MTEDFEIEEDKDRIGEFGTQGSKSIGTRDLEPQQENNVQVIDDALEPDTNPSNTPTTEEYVEANVVDSDESGYASKAKGLLAEAASYITGAHTTGNIIGFRVNKEKEPVRGGDYEAAANTTRRGFVQGAALLTGFGMAGRETLRSGDGEQPVATAPDSEDCQKTVRFGGSELEEAGETYEGPEEGFFQMHQNYGENDEGVVYQTEDGWQYEDGDFANHDIIDEIGEHIYDSLNGSCE